MFDYVLGKQYKNGRYYIGEIELDQGFYNTLIIPYIQSE